jgi:hypothetical protein
MKEAKIPLKSSHTAIVRGLARTVPDDRLVFLAKASLNGEGDLADE